eukprot:8780128-Pyramimonas_sp.AAC.1
MRAREGVGCARERGSDARARGGQPECAKVQPRFSLFASRRRRRGRRAPRRRRRGESAPRRPAECGSPVRAASAPPSPANGGGRVQSVQASALAAPVRARRGHMASVNNRREGV